VRRAARAASSARGAALRCEKEAGCCQESPTHQMLAVRLLPLALAAILAAIAGASEPHRPDCDRYGVCLPAGAMGDGTSDDTAAVQGALLALEAGQSLHFPPGVYLVRNLTLPDLAGITISGAAGFPSRSVLKLANDSQYSWVLASANFVENATFTGQPMTLRDMTFAGPADALATGTSGFIMMQWSSTVSGCTFVGFETGLRVSTVTLHGAPITTSMVNNRYTQNVFEQNTGAGFRIADPSRHTATDYFLLDSFSMYNKGSGFDLDTSAGALVRGNHLYSNGVGVDINIGARRRTLFLLCYILPRQTWDLHSEN
jgi:hypothetical protein